MSSLPLSPPEPDYRALFEATPGRYIVLSPDFTVVAVSDAYLSATMTQRGQLLGRNLFEVFPSNPADPASGGMSAVHGSLARVRQHGLPDTIALQQYDIRRPATEGGGFEQRFWSLHSYPLFQSGRQLRYIMHEIEDVTDYVRLQRQGTAQQELTESLQNRTAQMEHEIYRYVQEVQAARSDADAERERLRGLLREAPGMLAILQGPDLVYTFVNEAYRQLLGGRRMLEGLPMVEAVPDLAPELHQLLRDVYATGERFVGREFPVELDWSECGQRETKYLDFVYEPIRDNGRVEGIFVFAYEVTDLVRARQHVEQSEQLLRRALADAQTAQLRVELLSEASVRLASLQEYQPTLESVAALTVPLLADFCVFDVVDEHGTPERVAWADRGQVDRAWLAQAPAAPGSNAARPGPIAAALGGAGTQLWTHADDLEQRRAGAEKRSFLQELGCHALLTVPLVVREQPIGALTLGLTDAARRFTEADRELVEELARRAAVAIDNARLYAAAERRLAELTAVIDSMPDGVYIGTAAGISMTNEQGLAQLGYDSLAELDRDIQLLSAEIQTRDLDTGRRIAPEEEAFASALRGETLVRDVVVRHRKSGEDRIVRSAAAPIRYDGRILGAVAVNTDITDRKRAELERAELLRREQAARGVAEAAVGVRDDFLSVAAHELKTPVTSMRGYAQLVLKQLGRDKPLELERLQRSLEAINLQSEKLTRFIDQLLDVSKITAGRLVLNRQPLDLGRLVEDVVAGLRPMTAQHALTVQVAGNTVMAGDPLRLEQVITNLVTNAIKYSPEGGAVAVAVERVSAGAIRVSVADRGIGVPPEHRPFIFERFYQAHGSGYFGGMGLGLSISRHIVELHGGTLSAEFPAEGGTRMIVVLPVSSEAGAASTVEASG